MNLSRSTWRGVVSLLSGVVFGVGLAVAGMTHPNKVLGFLDVTGAWDSSLLLVLGGAVLLGAIIFRLALSRPTPVLDDHFHLSNLIAVDARLITGSAVFGMGWGIAGYCPGPAIASIGFGNPEVVWFIPAMLVGAVVQRLIDRFHHARRNDRSQEVALGKQGSRDLDADCRQNGFCRTSSIELTHAWMNVRCWPYRL